MAKRLYYAFVAMDVVDCFEEGVAEHNVEVVHKLPAVSENGEPIIQYLLKAEEGIINPKWRLM